MNAHEEKLAKALVLVGELMEDIVQDDGTNWDDMSFACVVDQLDEAHERLDKARKIMRRLQA